MGIQRRTDPDARVLRTRVGQPEQQGHPRPAGPDAADGVLSALGGAGGGLTCFLYDGYLCYEYNLFILTRTKIRSATPLTSGRRIVEVTTQYAEPRPGGPLTITVSVDREPVAEGVVPVIAPPLFTANDCLDVGTCLGSPVSLDYYDKAPYPFTGHFDTMRVEYT